MPAGVKVLWRPHDGPQTEALLRDEEEILYGGAKGGGKTACGIAWLVMGNPGSNLKLEADHSYINHPHYRALVLRRNMIDMGDWIDKAKRVFEPLGATFRERPLPLFEFRSGAKIVLGHLDDSDTYSKYQGQEFQRFLLEEATLVPDLLSYLMVRSCIRSVYPELRAQIFLTSNPGGPGHSWVRERFVKPKDAKGNLVPPNTTIVDPETGLTRIYIPAKLKDNPALMADPAYQKRLMQLPEAQRRAFLDGDWDALSGVFFCCDDQTEFLTSEGFRPIEQIAVGDLIASRTPDGTLVYAPCSRVVREHFEGELVTCETPQVNFAVTPNHNMYCEKDNGNGLTGEYEFVRADCLPRASVHPVAVTGFASEQVDETVTIEGTLDSESEWQACTCPVCGSNYEAKPHRIRHRRRTTCSRECSYKLRSEYYGNKAEAPIAVAERPQPITKRLTYATGDWLEFLGWYLSEGSLDDDTVLISQEKHADRVARVAALLDKMGLHHGYYGKSFKICSKVLADHLRQFGHSGDKFIPRRYMNYRRDLLWRLFDGLFLGDGHPLPNGAWSYYSISKQLADDVQELAIKLGRRAIISERKQSSGAPVGYYVGVSHPGKIATRVWRQKLQRRAYSGYVGCVTVEPYHTILTRRRGRILWTGNTEFRPNGPLVGEPEQASHVIPARPLESWLHRSIGMDWGFAHDGAAYWGCEGSDNRFHVYREMVEKNLGAEKWGAEVAIRSLEDLRGVEGGTMSLFLSPDAWDKRNDQRTIADQIAEGVRYVLGPDSVLLINDADGEASFFARLEDQKRFGIAIRKAPNQRIAGAAYIRSLLRWWPLNSAVEQKFDHDMFMRLLQVDSRRAMEYRAAFDRQQKAEVLPGLLIHDCCPRLIEGLQSVLHDERNSEDVEKRDGDDCYDAFRYLCFARSKERVREPESVFVARRMEQMAAMHGGALEGNTKMWVARKAEADYRAADASGAIFNVPRLSSRRGMEHWKN